MYLNSPKIKPEKLTKFTFICKNTQIKTPYCFNKNHIKTSMDVGSLIYDEPPHLLDCEDFESQGHSEPEEEEKVDMLDVASELLTKHITKYGEQVNEMDVNIELEILAKEASVKEKP